MLKKLFSRLGEYKRSALISPIFIGIEVIFEMLIPTLMAVIIDDGLNGNNGKGDMKFINEDKYLFLSSISFVLLNFYN